MYDFLQLIKLLRDTDLSRFFFTKEFQQVFLFIIEKYLSLYCFIIRSKILYAQDI